jgi:hypothetical protein
MHTEFLWVSSWKTATWKSDIEVEEVNTKMYLREIRRWMELAQDRA